MDSETIKHPKSDSAESHDFPKVLEKSSDSIINSELDFLANLSSVIDHHKLNFIKSIHLDYIYLKSFADAELEVNDTFVTVVIRLIEKLKDSIDEIYNFEKTSSKDVIAFRSICRHICTEVFYQINILSFESKKMIIKFHEQKGLEVLFAYLNNQNLVTNYVQFAADSNTTNLELCDNVLRRTVGTLVCLAKSFGNYKNQWRDCNAVKSLLTYLEKTKHINDNRIYTCMAIALVSNDDEIDSIPEIQLCLPEIIDMIRDCAKSISTNENLLRTQVEVDYEDEDNVVITESCYVNVGDTDWALTNLLSALYHIMVNDKIKQDIYYAYKINESLRSIIYYGNFIEKEYALNALWQLCFNKEIAKDVIDDEKLFAFVKDLSENSECPNVTKNASGIIWLLNKKLNPSMISKPQIVSNRFFKETVEKYILPSQLTQHIMISYNRGSRDLCLQIKAELEKCQFKVWIDVENISGSSLESMANAIENSFCILICMTEKYKQSPNCRAEGEYSFQLNRPIIPLIMQKDYRPDGWLGIILGKKIYINFTNNFDDSMTSLNQELTKVLTIDQKSKLTSLKVPVNGAHLSKELSQRKAKLFSQELNSKFKLNSTILNWSEKEVETWLIEKNVHPIIVENLNSFNGQVLSELFVMKEETPNYFYESITAGGEAQRNLLLKDLALFSHELKNLFLDNVNGK